jgi:hypothetical protein
MRRRYRHPGLRLAYSGGLQRFKALDSLLLGVEWSASRLSEAMQIGAVDFDEELGPASRSLVVTENEPFSIL